MNNNQSKLTTATTCAGCPIGLVAKTVLDAAGDEVVVTNATGCMEVTTTIYPNTSWKVPYIHSAFGNAGATISGIETAWRAKVKRRNFPPLAKDGAKRVSFAPRSEDGGFESKNSEDPKFVAFAGDGGTYDIGLQALSGALERGHDFLFVCYDNGAYMNTGNQRSGATPTGADTETTPFGKDSYGKTVKRKDIMAIVAAHHIPYAATANVGFLDDFKKKVKKAFETKGPKFLLVFSPCVNQWKYGIDQTINVAKMGTETNFWPLYEIEDGKYKINYEPKEPKLIEEFLQTQGRFRHIFKRDDKAKLLKKIQEEVDDEWERLKSL